MEPSAAPSTVSFFAAGPSVGSPEGKDFDGENISLTQNRLFQQGIYLPTTFDFTLASLRIEICDYSTRFCAIIDNRGIPPLIGV